ncbi:MAG TPA: adenylate/guanylate cyclase domain-containing protein, partial [Stellaceae bacterium]|nr:adenylate/guanylate cyclase domain-containing protein [Stellaceae bacterium]
TRDLIERARAAAVSATDAEVHRFFEAAPGVTDAFAAQASRGALPLDDLDRLAALFAERLRVERQLAWIGYAEAGSGRYAGATRYDDGEIVEYVADPKVDGGVPRQVAVAADGGRSQPSHAETDPYFVLAKKWYQLGIAKPGPVWTDFYQFTSGGPGITCMTRFRAPGATAATGLFHADLRVEQIADFLSTMHVGSRGGVFLADRLGHRLISPAGEAAASAGAAVDLAAARGVAAPGAPIAARSGGHTYEVVFQPVAVRGDLGLDLAVDIDLADITDGLYRQAMIAGGIAVAATLLAVFVGALLSARIARPVSAIAADMAAIGAFDLSPHPAPHSFVREIAELGEAVDRMKASLRSFSHYVPTDLVRRLVAAGKEAELGGEIRRLTMYFSDIRDFTTMSEGMQPRELVAAMGRYFEMMTAAITRHHGTVDKFMGDGIMAFYNAPGDLPDHARQACLGALEAQTALAELARNAPPGEPLFTTRIGLGLGDVLVGNIGTPTRFQYTLLGDEVNLASRLEGLNKLYGTLIMGNEAIAAEAGDGFEWRRLDRVAVKGRHQGTLVYELLGQRGAVASDVLAARDLYESALGAYFAGDFTGAEAGFEAAATARPDDLAARMMAERSRELSAAPPSAWDGIHVMHEK